MRPSQSVFIDVRGLRIHCRCWGDPAGSKLFLLHGWMDVSASFQFVVDALRLPWHVIAPDWRGYGQSDWSGADSYWFPDYFADLDRILEQFSSQDPVRLVGHSMGGNVGAMYAGMRPERVARVVNLEGFGLAGSSPEEAPDRYARWLAELRQAQRFREYESWDALAARLRKDNPRLTPERSRFLAQHWGMQAPDGRIVLRADPAHKRVNPVLYRLEEVKACWRRVRAPVLWVQGAESRSSARIGLGAEDPDGRKACFTDLTLRVVQDAGHMLHFDQPEQVAAILESFLA